MNWNELTADEQALVRLVANRYMTVNRLAAVSAVSKSTLRKRLTKLVAQGVLHSGWAQREARYLVNPELVIPEE